MTLPLLFVTAAVLVDKGGRALLSKRPEGKDLAGLWEFPGGKLDGAESPEEALARELGEELGITVAPDALVPLTFVSRAGPRVHLFMPLFLCRSWRGALRPLEGQALAWVAPQDFHSFPMPDADQPLAAWLEKNLSVFL